MIGPGANNANTQFHVTRGWNIGTKNMVITVRVNPIAIDKVVAVPIYFSSQTSVIMAAYCPLSQITDAPQINATAIPT